MRFVDVLAAARKGAGYTKQQLADALGVFWPRVNEWENGTFLPTEKYLAEIIRVLNLDEETTNRLQEAHMRERRAKMDKKFGRIPSSHAADAQLPESPAPSVRALERALSEAFDGTQHSISIAAELLAILRGQAHLFLLLGGNAPGAARALLDAAHELSKSGQPITAEALLVAVAAAKVRGT